MYSLSFRRLGDVAIGLHGCLFRGCGYWLARLFVFFTILRPLSAVTVGGVSVRRSDVTLALIA